jgi:hypothetical protein
MRSIQRTAPFILCVLSALTAMAEPGAADLPDLRSIVQQRRSELADVVNRFEADERVLERRYPVQASPARHQRFLDFYAGWQRSLDALDFDSLSLEGKVDFVLLRNLVTHSTRQLVSEHARRESLAAHAPFLAEAAALAESAARPDPVDPKLAAATLDRIRRQADEASKAFAEKLKDAATRPSPSDCKRLADLVESVRGPLRTWNGFFAEYDPDFAWWCQEPFKAADRAIDAYAKLVREKGVGITSENPNVIVGTPIGRSELLAELAFEMIPYTPEELVAIAEREFAWCEAEMLRAAQQMGLDDRMKAIERVKEAYVAPGEQPALIRALADDAIAFLKKNDLITVPPLAEETWRMEMMSADRQLVAPFFLGGDSILVAFPTASMSQENKLMSLRGNNRHFSHAAVFHELIPGHNLQAFARPRFNPHRDVFSTAFWGEGWALHWEMLMWDLGYHATPEDKVGALFWRSHRCARIICSLKYHLGEMSAQEWVEYLVNKVGHERANAEGEVRRSVAGGYGPLYQVGYMIGGLQFRALHRDLVGSGKMTNKAFHDAVMHENNMPVEMVRALLSGQAPGRDFTASWKFDDGKAAGGQK